MNYKDYKALQFEMRDHVGWLTLNRPERMNAMSWDIVLELHDFFGSLEDNLDIRVVVIRGAGASFCAGLDLQSTPGFEAGATMDQGAPARFQPRGFMFQRKFADIYVRMRHAPQPIIASVRGSAIGGGFALAMASDIRIASTTARFNIGAPRIGFSAGDMGMSYFLPRLIGLSQAALYMFTCRFIDAPTAERMGLVAQVVPEDQLDAATEEVVKELLKISPFSLRMTKEVLNANVDAPCLPEAQKLENRTQLLCSFVKDTSEAVKATFVERRAPVYTDD
ncbi:MAG: enoyl-CoA hydratase/isomerase family protein [Chloroflexi bacterium]|nr:enoyl-CoA hydratase/isomerase family protein [Chloroflexota bacterium]